MNRKVSVIGLGYVGLPLAVAFGKKGHVIGFDIHTERIEHLKQGNDRNKEVTTETLKSSDIFFTSNPSDLQKADFHIVAVPTPVDESKKPDLSLILKASETLGKVLKKGDIVVYESTVYPGATEEDCLPVLERVSGLKAGKDFKLGYSPERINPGDHEHRLETIIKVVSGQDAESLEIIASVYAQIALAGVYRASSIRVAEAAKVIENTQRDLNIALMNELAIIFQRLGLDTQEVLEAAGTKWNFLKFKPGLVGGHCIGVDPYYLTHKAEKVGYIPQVILAGRRINDDMGRYVASQAVKQLTRAGHSVPGCTVTILGLTFKENCPDLRNSRVIDIITELKDYGIKTQVCDPLADPQEAKREYGVELVPESSLPKADALILAVAHQTFAAWKAPKLLSLMKESPLVLDIKSLFPPQELAAAGIQLWRL